MSDANVTTVPEELMNGQQVYLYTKTSSKVWHTRYLKMSDANVTSILEELVDGRQV
jgi:hypothetical protein